MTCEFRGACAGLPICFEGCGKCGKHCACVISTAKALAGRMEIKAICQAYQTKVSYQMNLINRYRKRWRRLRREFDDLREIMNHKLNVTDPS